MDWVCLRANDAIRQLTAAAGAEHAPAIEEMRLVTSLHLSFFFHIAHVSQHMSFMKSFSRRTAKQNRKCEKKSDIYIFMIRNFRQIDSLIFFFSLRDQHLLRRNHGSTTSKTEKKARVATRVASSDRSCQVELYLPVCSVIWGHHGGSRRTSPRELSCVSCVSPQVHATHL